MIDFEKVKECHEKFKINEVAFISSERDTADALTKVKVEPIWKEMVHNSQLSHPL